MTTKTSDRIEKQIVLRAGRARVWRALTDAKEFGTWFRVELETAFAPGKKATGAITHAGYEHVRFEATVERMEQERCSRSAGTRTRSTRRSTTARSRPRSSNSSSPTIPTARCCPSSSPASTKCPPTGAAKPSCATPRLEIQLRNIEAHVASKRAAGG
jgi:hypothetical protein